MEEKNVISLKNAISLIESLNKDFLYSIRLKDVKKFEDDLKFINLFSNEYMLVNESEKLFFGYFTSRYGLFKISDILDVLLTGFNEEDILFITRYFVKLNGEKLLYINSYGGFHKEALIHKPSLFIFTKKHTIGNIGKRNLYEIVKVFDERKDELNSFLKTEVANDDLKMLLEEFGVRQFKKLFNLEVKESEINEETISPFIKNYGDIVNTAIKIVDNNHESQLVIRGLVNTSVKLTKKLVEKYDFYKLF